MNSWQAFYPGDYAAERLRWLLAGQARLLVRRAELGLNLGVGSLVRLADLCFKLAAAEERRG